ncbi:iron chelate uptake ABC transporter family permease subunit [Acinetobacter sp. 1000160]|uniref:iron chelate uptake ABC transporter family permease subunit n=1 Tax=Acinetobacter sp. 1000160 TaxID=1310800 RepID=UPI000446D75B|nr:iron chelate uptake ABC transporter family permease subunit [Acinetobacter sp. 1000160]EXB48725.1 fecCD transport family protein [Acinetobacter baumannii 146457]EYT22370.1 fecCD transport family protein [Acinetobacter sp. 1000160]
MRITKLWLIYLIVACLAVCFLFLNSGLDVEYVIPHRLLRLATIVVAGMCIAVSSIVFQTLVGNRILTPSIMGYEAVYLLWQVLLLFVWGTYGLSQLGVNGNFFISIVLMLLYSWFIHTWLLPYGKKDVFLLLLLGLVLTMVIGTVTQFIQLKISPGEFSVFQGLSYASFNRAQTDTLLYASLAVVITLFLARKALPVLDVLVLGREQAISLGIHHHRYVSFYLALIAVLVAVSTSLIGPTVFMGVFIANMTYALAKSYQHKLTLPMGCALTIAIFIAAQILVEHVFNYKTTVSILVNLVCGIYFLALAVRTRGVT